MSRQSIAVAFEVMTGGQSLDDWIWRNAVQGATAHEIAERLSYVLVDTVPVDFVTAWLDRA